jgi:hypothetical protein
MAYEVTEWHTGDKITEEKMNHLESGVAANDVSIAGILSKINALFIDDDDGLIIQIGDDTP